MTTSRKPTRRQFLGLAGATTVLARGGSFAFGQETRPVAPGDRIRIACLGAGSMGQGDTRTALKVPGVELVAVADIYNGRFAECREKFGKEVQTTRDYRELLDRRDIDAVIVASPDHWHAQMAIDALEKGKDVYCEKPMMHSIEEGAAMAAAQKKTGRILQVGSQCVSSIVYEKARELLASGALGRVNLIEGWTNRNSVMGALHWPIPKDASPETIDWDRFLGRAPKRPSSRPVSSAGGSTTTMAPASPETCSFISSRGCTSSPGPWARAGCSARAACATGRTAARSPTSWSRPSTIRLAAARAPST